MEKLGHEFETEQEEVYGKICRVEMDEGNVVIILQYQR